MFNDHFKDLMTFLKEKLEEEKQKLKKRRMTTDFRSTSTG